MGIVAVARLSERGLLKKKHNRVGYIPAAFIFAENREESESGEVKVGESDGQNERAGGSLGGYMALGAYSVIESVYHSKQQHWTF